MGANQQCGHCDYIRSGSDLEATTHCPRCFSAYDSVVTELSRARNKNIRNSHPLNYVYAVGGIAVLIIVFGSLGFVPRILELDPSNFDFIPVQFREIAIKVYPLMALLVGAVFTLVIGQLLIGITYTRDDTTSQILRAESLQALEEYRNSSKAHISKLEEHIYELTSLIESEESHPEKERLIKARESAGALRDRFKETLKDI